jgi:hypothetical protein
MLEENLWNIQIPLKLKDRDESFPKNQIRDEEGVSKPKS